MGAITMRLGKVSGPEGALKVKGVKSRLMRQDEDDCVGHATAIKSVNLMKNRMVAYAFGDNEPCRLGYSLFLAPGLHVESGFTLVDSDFICCRPQRHAEFHE